MRVDEVEHLLVVPLAFGQLAVEVAERDVPSTRVRRMSGRHRRLPAEEVVDVASRRPVGGAIGRHWRQGSDARPHFHAGRDRLVAHLHAMPAHGVIGRLAEVDHAAGHAAHFTF